MGDSKEGDEVQYKPWDLTNATLLKKPGANSNMLCYVGSVSEEQRGVLLLSKPALNESALGGIVSNTASKTAEEIFRNNKYSKYNMPVVDTLQVELIAPATERDVKKYSEQKFYFVRETSSIYEEVTAKYIDSIEPSALQWVYNILDGSSEKENVLYREDSFLLVKDYKWMDESSIRDFHILGLVMDKKIRSIRDLRGEHIMLLKDIRAHGLRVLQDRFKIPHSQIRVYFHYLPTFYHLHVHFDHISSSLEASRAVGKAVLLDDVIDALVIDEQYYTKANITFMAGSLKDESIIKALSQAGVIETE